MNSPQYSRRQHNSQVQIQASIFIGIGFEGARFLAAMYRRMCNMLGQHPPVIRYLLLIDSQALESLSEEFDEFQELENSGALSICELAGEPFPNRIDGLHNYADVLDQLKNQISKLDSFVRWDEHRTWLADRGLSLLKQRFSTYYLFGSLANILTSTVLVELPYFIAHSGRLPDISLNQQEQYTSVNGIFLLPGFADKYNFGNPVNNFHEDDDFHEDDQDQIKAQQESKRAANANAYAALRELNAYLSGHQAYAGADGVQPEIRFSIGESPFPNGRCILISPEREEERAKIELKDGTHLAVDWLANQIVGPEAGRFADNQHFVDGGVAGVGVYSWIVPYHELVRFYSNRLIVDLFQHVLSVAPELTASFGQQQEIGISLESAKAEITNSRTLPLPYQQHLERFGKQSFRSTLLLAYQEMEHKLLQSDSQHRQQLTAIEEIQQLRAESLAEDKLKVVAETWQKLVDDSPKGGLHEATSLLRKLRDEVQREQQNIRYSNEALRQHIKRLSEAIRRHSATYQYSVQALMPVKLRFFHLSLSLVCALLGFTVLPVLIWLFVGPRQIPASAVSILAACSVLFTSLLAFVLYKYIRIQRAALEANFHERRKADWLLTCGKSLENYLNLLAPCYEDALGDLLKLEALLREIAETSSSDAKNENLGQRLYNFPVHAHEYSVLEPEFVERVYRQLTLGEVQEQLKAMLADVSIPLHEWGRHTPDEVRQTIGEYVRRSSALRSVNVVEVLITNMSEARRKELLLHGYNASTPLLDIEKAELSSEAYGSQDSELSKHTRLSYDENSQRNAELLKQELKILTNNDPIPGNNPYALIQVALQDNVPMYLVRSVRALRHDYNDFAAREGWSALHLNGREKLLPEIVPMMNAGSGELRSQRPPLSGLPIFQKPSVVLALAKFFNIITWGPNQYQFARPKEKLDQWLLEIEADVENKAVVLGEDADEAIDNLTKQPIEYLFKQLLSDTLDALQDTLEYSYRNDEIELAKALYLYWRENQPELSSKESDAIRDVLDTLRERNPLEHTKTRNRRASPFYEQTEPRTQTRRMGEDESGRY